MTTLSEIQEAVRALPGDQSDKFSSWFDGYEEELWVWVGSHADYDHFIKKR